MTKIGTTILLKNKNVKIQVLYTRKSKRRIIVPDLLIFDVEDEGKGEKITVLDFETKQPIPVRIIRETQGKLKPEHWYELAWTIAMDPNPLYQLKGEYPGRPFQGRPYPEGDFAITEEGYNIQGTFSKGIACNFWVIEGVEGLEYSGYFRNGKKNGSWIFYDLDSPITTGSYLNDRKSGFWFHFSTETKIIFD